MSRLYHYSPIGSRDPLFRNDAEGVEVDRPLEDALHRPSQRDVGKDAVLQGPVDDTEGRGSDGELGAKRAGDTRQRYGRGASWEIDGETVETVSDFIFWGFQNHCRW